MLYRCCWAQTLKETAKMSQRLLDNTKWLCYLLVIQASSILGQTYSARGRPPSGSPSTVEAQAKFFQYRHLPTTDEFNQGHRLGSERHFTERHERARPSEGLFSAKVRWGDKKGGYGEHYWDLNHAGHTGNHENDGYNSDHDSHDTHDDHDTHDGHDSYDVHDSPYHNSGNREHFNEPSDTTPNYNNDDYEPDSSSSYGDTGRAKRAHAKTKTERKHHRHSETYEEEVKPLNIKRNNKEELQTAAANLDEQYTENDEEGNQEEAYEKPKPRRQKHRKQNDNQQQTNHQQPKEKKQFVLVVSQKDDSEKEQQIFQPQYSKRQHEAPKYLPKKQSDLLQYTSQKQPEQPQYVPYESGAGVRQYLQPDVSSATTVPRLFLEPSTGHVIDRTTGQAYVLQPILA